MQAGMQLSYCQSHFIALIEFGVLICIPGANKKYKVSAVATNLKKF
jgi:hypothetical protein